MLHRLKIATLLISVGFVVACSPAVQSNNDRQIEKFTIAANTVPCHGLAPRRCLVVNGEFFYGHIQGYEHQEGRGAVIYVEKTRRPEPIPADASAFIYRRVADPR